MSHYASHFGPCQQHGRPTITCLHAFACELELVRRHPEGFAVVWVIWYGDVAIKTKGQRNYAAEDEKPAPAGEAKVVVHAIVDAGLEVAAEHAGGVAGGVEDGDSFGEFYF